MAYLIYMELNEYSAVSTSTSILLDRTMDDELLLIKFDISFPALSCAFASVDVNDVLGTTRINITKYIRKYPIYPNTSSSGPEFLPAAIRKLLKHGDEGYDEGSVSLTSANFERFIKQYTILVVNFFAPWCDWSNNLKPSWEKTSQIIRERYDPYLDWRILLAKVDCSMEVELCRRNHIQGYPSIQIFRGRHHDHEFYSGDRDTETLVATMESLVALIPKESDHRSLVDNNDDATDITKRPAALTGGCRIIAFLHVKKVPGNFVIAARSDAHCFDTSLINMTHIINHLTIGKRISPRILADLQRLSPYFGLNLDRLKDREYITERDDANGKATFEHYLQIVKTELVSRRLISEFKLIDAYEYTAHSSLVESAHPVVKFDFELSPWKVLVTENQKSIPWFVTNVCVTLGGVFTVAGILDSLLHNTWGRRKKIKLGKNI
ncbi:hypothetical protein AQUCO_03700109v1 [Aquilegia coerulea]|nr:hypothetical protein AQUCO_03700109v1 [Aquilegia coerulea]